ncbi:MAG: dynamin family protein [Clostridium sp.]|nr:dynamin family protein [Clostridium sp.]
MDTNYFSWDNFGEIARIGDHLEYVSGIIENHPWPEETLERYRRKIDVIKTKQNDRALNLSVIGEFSTGKSTFINALVREELLVSSVIQGTTVSNTIIEYAPKHSMLVYLKDGSQKTLVFESLPEMKEAIREYTATTETARGVKYVRLGVPSENLKAGIRIIDTPGTNSLEAWHEDVTREALTNLSDLSIILVDANQPLPETLLNFIQSTAIAPVLHRCAFVITRIDMIPEREHKRMITFVTRKLKGILGHDPMVVPYVSTEVLKKVHGEPAEEKYVGMSLENEKQIHDHMSAHRVKVQAHKLTSLITTLYADLDASMARMSQSLNERLETLNRTRTTVLTPFLDAQKTERKRELRFNTDIIRGKLRDELEKTIEQEKTEILDVFDHLHSTSKIKEYVDNEIQDDVDESTKKLIKIAKKHNQKLSKLFKKEIETFCKLFEEEFRNLQLLETDFKSIKPEAPKTMSIESSGISQAAEYAAQGAKSESRWTDGGLATGAVIGTFIAPGIGTVIGGVIGGIAALFMGDQTDRVRKEVLDSVRPSLTRHFNTVMRKATKVFDDNVTDLVNQVDKEINRYRDTYQERVNQEAMRVQWEKRKLNERIEKIEEEKTGMASRRRTLEDIQNHINV